jgi:hypothetical protein
VGQKSSLLDLVISTSDLAVSNISHAAPLGKGDHDILSFSLEMDFHIKTTTNPRRNFRNADYPLLNDIIASVKWEEELRDWDVNTQLEIVNNFLQDIIHTFVPVTKNRSAKPSWIDRDVTLFVNRKKRAYRSLQINPTPSNLVLYKKARNEAVQSIRSARKSFEEDIISRSIKQPKILFSYINRNKKTQPASSLKNMDGSICSEDCLIASKLNDYFTACFNPSKLTPPGVSQYSGPIEFSCADVFQSLQSIKQDTSCGPDGLTAVFLNNCAASLALPFFIIMESSIRDCTFPDTWKDAYITPVFKNGSPYLPENYRPISLLSIVSKILERIVHKQLFQQCEDLGILPASQHGFMPGRSCLTNLLSTYDEITRLVDQGVSCDTVFLDFSKAFDSISHTTLITKLQTFGIQNNIVAWLHSYLFNRRQCVHLRGSKSTWIFVPSGVPQGSVLGPLLFNIYMSDLHPLLKSKSCSYADDFKLFSPSFSSTIQEDLDRISSWASLNLLSINNKKSTVLHFGHANPRRGYFISGNKLSLSSSTKDLGVIIDSSLKFDVHVDSIIKKTYNKAHFIMRSFCHLNTKLFSALFKTFIRPCLEYCNQICRPVYSTHLEKLELCQRRITKWCPAIRKLDYTERLQRLNLPSIKERFRRGDVILVYQLLNGFYKIDHSRFFSINTNITRGHCMRLSGCVARLNLRHRFFSERVITLWNSLPNSVVTAPTLNSFKARLDRI